MIIRTIKMLSILAGFTGLSACVGSTQLLQSWYEDSYSGSPEKILVLGVFGEEVQRRAFESKFVELVQAGGKQAVAGYTLMSEQQDYDEEEEIVAAVEQSGADTVLITHYIGTEEQQRWVSPNWDYVPSMAYPHYRGYYGSVSAYALQPGYTVVDKVVSLETRVYAVDPDKLVWMGKTKSVNPSSGDKIVEELVGIVADDMRKNGLIE